MTKHEITLYFHRETENAILVGENPENVHGDHVWLPKSQVDYEFNGLVRGKRQVIVTAPEWLLIDKGLEHLA